MDDNRDSDPTPGIRAVIMASFLSGDVAGLLYLAFTGTLLESLWLNPIALLGASLGIGVVGTMLGGFCGFSLRLLLGERGPKNGWLVPVLVAAAASAATGLLIPYALISLLFPLPHG